VVNSSAPILVNLSAPFDSVDYQDLKPQRKKRDIPVKYRDPENPENTWSGMGKPRRWLQQYLDQGRTLEEFAVQ
jgi:DNA-binding protein H-NS